MTVAAVTEFSIDLPVGAEWANAERLRASIQSCLTAMSFSNDSSNAVAVVTAELVENAVKYGAYDAGRGTFRIRISGDTARARIVVESPVNAADESVARLFATLSWIDAFPSAEDAYRARMLEIANAPSPGSSRLGLVRLAYEASCKLSAEIDGELLRVTAELPV